MGRHDRCTSSTARRIRRGNGTAPIFERAASAGLMPFSTPFDATAVDFLESLDVACYKIASFENTDLPLIRQVAATGKPMIISTGMATLAELDETVRAAREARAAATSCCCNAPARTRPPPRTPTPAPSRTCASCSTARSACRTTRMGIGVAVASVALGATRDREALHAARADGGVDSRLLDGARGDAASWSSRPSAPGRRWGGSLTDRPTSRRSRCNTAVRFTSCRISKPATCSRARTCAPSAPVSGCPRRTLEQVLGQTVKTDVKRGTALRWGLGDARRFDRDAAVPAA